MFCKHYFMETHLTPITGYENYETKSSPYYALVEFYDAFNKGKMELMSNNWANIPDIAMDNPLGGIMRGWNNIKNIYERIFNGKAEVYVEYYDYKIHELGDIFYTEGRERGYFEIDGDKIELAIRTSRVFQRIGEEWKQVHHHGSIESPELLHKYQSLVNNEK